MCIPQNPFKGDARIKMTCKMAHNMLALLLNYIIFTFKAKWMFVADKMLRTIIEFYLG